MFKGYKKQIGRRCYSSFIKLLLMMLHYQLLKLLKLPFMKRLTD